ncbi:MAG: hydantoinase/oxoprolinase family protein [Phycisphaeraceae bacterium]
MNASTRIRPRIGIDTGGTFTDLVLVDSRAQRVVATFKLLSTPDDPARAVLDGMDRLLTKAGLPPRREQPPDVVHGSTVATNALLERKTSRTAFVTTAGFEDTLALARQDRPDLYALVPDRPATPVASERCLGVEERVAFDGRVLRPLEQASVDRLVARVRELGVESLAISLLHGYANPEHERRLADALRAALGDALHLTVAHELLPEYREYERAATCVVNAVVAPRMVRYLHRLGEALGERRLRIMGSHGGTLPPAVIRSAPVRTVLSGPAGGVLGAAEVARAAGVERVISFDMGGTSTDVALCDPAPRLTSEGEAGGLPVRLPMIDMHTVGAGGGSIAWLDPGGALRVGPQSAGADPGPACYGRQRGEPTATVTDAHVVLGHLPADLSLGESLAIDRAAATAAVQAIADRAGLGLHQAALGILRIAEATMARAVQRISLQRGRDPRPYTLVPFGGAGGLHACRLAEALGMTRVLVPNHPGLLSAVGMLGAAPKYTFSQALLLSVPPIAERRIALADLPAVREAFATLGMQADGAMADEGLHGQQRIDQRAVDLRYLGQSYELTISLDGDGDPLDKFLAEHERLYGYASTDKPLELVAARLQTAGVERPLRFATLPARTASTGHGPPTTTVHVHDGQREQRWRMVARDDLQAGDRLDRPTIIREYSATTLMPPGWTGEVNATGQLLLQRAEAV